MPRGIYDRKKAKNARLRRELASLKPKESGVIPAVFNGQATDSNRVEITLSWTAAEFAAFIRRGLGKGTER